MYIYISVIKQGDLREQDYQRVFSHQERESRYGSEYFGSERDDQERNESPGVHADHPHMRSYERPYDPMSPEARREFLDRYKTCLCENVEASKV